MVDFEYPEKNGFLCVRELWVRGDLYRRRADIVGFVNGLPLLFMELKNVSKDIRAAYEQNFLDYKDTVPHLFHHNALVVLANGVDAKLGSLSSRFEHFHEWMRLTKFLSAASPKVLSQLIDSGLDDMLYDVAYATCYDDDDLRSLAQDFEAMKGEWKMTHARRIYRRLGDRDKPISFRTENSLAAEACRGRQSAKNSHASQGV